MKLNVIRLINRHKNCIEKMSIKNFNNIMINPLISRSRLILMITLETIKYLLTVMLHVFIIFTSSTVKCLRVSLESCWHVSYKLCSNSYNFCFLKNDWENNTYTTTIFLSLTTNI